MIYFLVTAQNRLTIDRYLASWGRHLLRVLQPISYNHFFAHRHYIPGIYIFSDIELLNQHQREEASRTWNILSETKDTVLMNHPVHSMRRYELLKTLKQQGINRFDVYRPDESMKDPVFPVFIRGENDHKGSVSDLLYDADQLRAEIQTIKERQPDLDLLVTEFCDSSDYQGIFRKYSVFYVNGLILPRHLFFSNNWCLKMDDLHDKEYLDEEWQYINSNPHQERLREIFHLASIDYGRIDYSLVDGDIQVWEINTNPIILTSEMQKNKSRCRTNKKFSDDIGNVLTDLNARQQSADKGKYPFERVRSYSHVLDYDMQETSFGRRMYPHVKRVKNIIRKTVSNIPVLGKRIIF